MTSRVPYLFAMLCVLLIALMCTGCAVWPQEEASSYAEGGWLVLDTVDTLQTIQIAKHPCYREADPIAAGLYGSEHPNEGRVIATNVVLAFGHTLVTSWLDDEVQAHEDAQDDYVGAWYVARVAWHTISLLGTGAAVAHNYSIGLTPTSADPCPAPAATQQKSYILESLP